MEAILESIPDLLFLPVNLVRDIRKAKILLEEQREPGKPDIIIESPLGFTEQVTRDQLVKRFTHANGSKIRLGSWKKGLPYMIMTLVQEQMYGIFIPSQYPMDIAIAGETFRINRDDSGTGTYVICRPDEAGDIQKDDAWVISPRCFRKMFSMSGSIQSNADQCEELQRKIASRLRRGNDDTEQQELASIDDMNTRMLSGLASRLGTKKEVQEPETLGVQDTTLFKDMNAAMLNSLASRLGTKKEVSTQTVEEEADNTEQELTYKVTHRVIKNGKNVGFILEDTDGGSDAYTKREILSLCKQGKIINLGVRERDGKEYLYGIGVRLTELPETES